MGAIPKTLMRSQVSGLIHDNGSQIRIKRFSSTLNSSGRLSGTFVSAGTIEGWLQPYDALERTQIEGVVGETTNMVFIPYGAQTLMPEKDKLLPVGDTYSYDVLAETIMDTHKEIFLKKVPRT